MKVLIAASGSRGDVQPYVALGQGLKAAGHTVQILTSDDFQVLVTEAGLGFCSSGHSIEAMLQSDAWRTTLESGNFLAIVLKMRHEMRRHAHQLTANMSAYFEDADLVLGGMAGLLGAFSVAEKLGIPVIQTHVFPLTPTRAFGSPLTPTLPLGRVLNRASFHLMRQVLWQSSQLADKITRKALGLRPMPPWGPYQALVRQRVPVLYGFSKHIVPPPSDWDSLQHVTGYWFHNAPSVWEPPTDLLHFLQAGDPPVYVGFGSMGNRNPEETTHIALKALSVSGQRGVLASGWGGLAEIPLPESVYMIRAVPHDWLFPRMAAVVHHGGAGTTAAGLRAGVPNVIVPFFGDQRFWGQRVSALGAGTAPIPRKQMNAENLAEAISIAVQNPTMRQRATELGRQIEVEDGVGQAVALIERYYAGQH